MSARVVKRSSPAVPVVAAREVDVPPGRLILTIFGLYARAAQGRLPVAGIVELMAGLGVDATAVRSAVSRLKRRGVIVSVRDPRAAYALSPAGLALLEEGDRQIFAARPARLEDGWCLVTFSVPESERDQRHRIRVELSRLGFGAVAAGVAIAPGRLMTVVQEVLDAAGLADYVDVFRAEAAVSDRAALADKVATWWDLAALDALYRDFVDRHENALAATDPAVLRPGDAFRGYVPMLTHWRRLPYLDPGLPDELLPPGWSGGRARDLFEALSSALAEPARQHAAQVIPGLGRPVAGGGGPVRGERG